MSSFNKQSPANISSVRKNLNESLQNTVEQENQQPLQSNYVDLSANQTMYDTVNALEELATKNGYSVPAESLKKGHVQQSEDTCLLKSNFNVPSVTGTNQLSHGDNCEQISKTSAPVVGKKRRSSKSRRSLDVDKNNTVSDILEAFPVERHNSDNENIKQARTSPAEPEVIHKNKRHSSRSSIRSVEENNVPEEGEIVVLDSSFSSNKDSVANKNSTQSPCTESVDSDDKNLYPDRTSKTNIPDSLSITSPNSVVTDNLQSPVGTSLREMQLCIPKLIIKKVRQRKGSQEFETHEVRTVEPMEEVENRVPKRSKKRRRSSSDGTLTEKSDEEERG